ncbi:MAG: aspartate kinase [Flavobacteriales bacterium]|nr:aspartate kinase [Flavobacteriales bacterium]
MKVYKFGGASIKDAEGVRNISQLILNEYVEPLIIVVSAMGKTTNMLEKVVNDYYANNSPNLDEVKLYHYSILKELFDKSHSIFDDVNNLFVEIEWAIEDAPTSTYNYEYDQIVSVGELLSTKIVSAFLKQEGFANKWIDARDIIRTDNTYRNARIDWKSTKCNIAKHISNSEVFLTQGFIGCTSENFTTTLGREGSDFTAAILGYAIDAEEVTIWKDVDGMLNADPRYFGDVKLLNQLSFTEAIELAYFGAKVIHPKTIQPLKEKNISLKIKSFLNPNDEGTIIFEDAEMKPFMPSFIIKENQILISISANDLSFIVEDHLSYIFSLFAKNGLAINLMQNSAVSFSVCIDNDSQKILDLISELKKDFKVQYNDQLTLCTIRHYDQAAIDRVVDEKKILLEQKSRQTIQFVFSN